ncbi:MAG: NTP transferase domain-containing protein [Myxococcota bacterium]
MKLSNLPVQEAEACLLAHKLKVSGISLPKGHRLNAAELASLVRAGVRELTVVRLEADDIHEDDAAEQLRSWVEGPGVRSGPARTGRINFFAEHRGLLTVDSSGVDDFNRTHEAVALSTLASFRPVEAREMVATLKIIPFALPMAVVSDVRRSLAAREALVSVRPFLPLRARLILTAFDHTSTRLLQRTEDVQRARLAFLGGEIDRTVVVEHEPEAVARAIRDGLATDLVLILGASAICDRQDVLPSAVEHAGGRVDHFGMPVDPGNLILLARAGSKLDIPVLGLPGCARSSKPSGFDWVLWRIAAGVPVTGQDLMGLGVGGLLHEVELRPTPRSQYGNADAESSAPVAVSAVILAAGRSSRMGGRNKLLLNVKGQPMVRHPVEAAVRAGLDPVVVVTGHEHQEVKAALRGLPCHFVHNERYGEGMSTSLRTGIRALPTEVDGVMVFLGDMPFVSEEHVRTLLEDFKPHGPGSIRVPTHGRKRGHPVLWSRKFFGELEQVTGDEGARGLIARHRDEVERIEVRDGGVHVDIDTPDTWADLRKGVEPLR